MIDSIVHLYLQALLSVDLRETAVGVSEGNDNIGADQEHLEEAKEGTTTQI